VDLDVFDAHLHLELPVPDRPIGLADVVAPARRLADEMSALAVGEAERLGRRIPCRKGCAACCRHLVPLSPPEAFQLAEDVSQLRGSTGRSVLAGFADGFRRMTETALPADLQHLPPDIGKKALADAAGRWYATLNLDCPLLRGGQCLLYAHRPVACRCYHVLSPPRFCEEGGGPGGHRLGLPLSITEALCQLASEMEAAPPQAVPLPMALSWAASNVPRGLRRWPAADMIERFAAIVREHAATPDAQPALPSA
jgi:Fe-S-cluster containining protein